MFFVRFSNWLKPSFLACIRRQYNKPPQCGPPDKTKVQLVELDTSKAIIVGGTGCVGLATANQLLCNKLAQLALIDTDICKGKDAVTGLNCTFGKDKAMFIKSDVTDKADITDALRKAKQDLKNINLLVNTFAMWDEHSWEKMIKVNLIGALTVNEAALDILDKPGTIINVIGVPGLEPFPPSPKLAASYAGVLAFSQCRGSARAASVAGVRTIALCAGVTESKFSKVTPSKACCPSMFNDLQQFMRDACWQKPDSVAKAVVEAVKFAPTGTVWVVEGSRMFHVKMPNLRDFRELKVQFI